MSAPGRRPGTRPGGDRGVGVFGTTFGFLAFLILLLGCVQVLFGLYARTTVTSVAADVARRAATEGAALDAVRLRVHTDAGRARLGRYGDDVDLVGSLADADGDGRVDTVVIDVVAALPTLLPRPWTLPDAGRFERRVRARLEVADPAGASVTRP